MKFFHFAPMRLGPGSIVEPGNFGRVIRATQHAIQGSEGSLIAGYVGRELVFELMRVKSFPTTKPSRLTSVFGCPTMLDAQQYAAINNRFGQQVLHEVELVNKAALTHVAPISHCDMTVGSLFVGPTEQKAQDYWAAAPGDPTKGNEIIAESAIRIIQAI